jgi:NTE family protein
MTENLEHAVTAKKTGLVLSGGGARAAYQVGVLLGIGEILPSGSRQPFPIISGTSAGAINALGLAGQAGNFRARTRALASLWASLESESIYRTHIWGVTRNALSIVRAMLSRRYAERRALALLDNAPLRELLSDAVKFTHIDRAIARGELDAIAVTAVNYTNGLTTTFYQSRDHIQPWLRSRRVAEPTELTIDHLLASSALPTLFPATRIGNDWYGDGALRQTRPLSPAIHLGAERLLIIGVNEVARHGPEVKTDSDNSPPSIPQVMGHMMNSVFLDAMDADLETLEQINWLLEDLQHEARQPDGPEPLRQVDFLTISPSHSLAQIARDHIKDLPRSMRFFLTATGSIKQGGSGGALSYILFEHSYCQKLIELGYSDAMAKSDDIRDFFGIAESRSGRRQRIRRPDRGPVVHKPLSAVKRAWYRLFGKRPSRV